MVENVEIQKLEESIRILETIDILRHCEYEVLRQLYLLSKSLNCFYK